MENPKVTVFVPTWFGEQYLEEVLTAVFSQKTAFNYEVLVFDTSSTDRTPDILRKFASEHSNMRWRTIKKSEFGHGKTRNQAAHEANGEYIAFITQDATPAHDRWLYELTKPFELNEKIVGVMGKQVARPHAIPMLKYEIAGTFRNFGPDFSTSIFYKDDFIRDQATYDATRFYSDVNSAARVSALTGELPYQDVAYAEDQLFGEDIIEKGLYKAYAPRAAVIHSNDLKLREYARRMFDETYGLRKNGTAMATPSLPLTVKLIARGVVKDSFRIVRDGDYGIKRKLYWLVVNPLFYIEKWRGIRRALLADMQDETVLKRHSLENTKNSSTE